MPKIVMFVDDDEAFLDVVRRASRKIPAIASILEATDGASALKTIEQLLATDQPLPDMIFVDINMPILDGFGFLEGFRTLRDRHPDLIKVKPVAMLTSSDHERDRKKAQELGADEYIVKGFGLDEIRTTISRFVT